MFAGRIGFPARAERRRQTEACLRHAGEYREGHMSTRLMMLTGLVALMLASVSAAQADRRVAMVVGNSAYASAASLRNPRNDASDMAETLKKLGFEVELGLDLDQQNFAVAIEK